MINKLKIQEEIQTRMQARVSAPIGSALLQVLFSPGIWPKYSIAPASSALRFHHAYVAGLVEHCVDVWDLATAVNDNLPDEIKSKSEDIAVVALLHDLHKAMDGCGRDYYVPNMIKNGTVRSEAIPYASSEVAHTFTKSGEPQLAWLLNNAKDVWADGDLSLSVLASLAPVLLQMLSSEAVFAIRHHAGMYDRKNRHLLTEETPLMLLMHYADMLSSRKAKWMKGKTE